MFSTDDSKKLVTVWAKYLNAPERFYLVLSENSVALELTVCEILRTESNSRVCKKILKLCIFKGWHLANGSSESNNP